MSAQEFTRWILWMDAEQIGPWFDRSRHAQLMAASMNGPHCGKRDKSPWVPADFLMPDPWAVAEAKAEPTFDQIKAVASGMFNG